MTIKLNIENTKENTSEFNPQTIEVSIAEQPNSEETFDVQTNRVETKEKQIITYVDYLTFSPQVLAALLKVGTFPAELDLEKVDLILKEYGHQIVNSK